MTLQTRTTQGIRISVEAMFVPEQSSARHHTYVFAYRIGIHNESPQTVQLMTRHWDIQDGTLDLRVVEGDGVVGKQPVLEPGASHTYMSGSVIKTPVGKMEGWYDMVRIPTGETFRVEIPSFMLVAPYVLN